MTGACIPDDTWGHYTIPTLPISRLHSNGGGNFLFLKCCSWVSVISGWMHFLTQLHIIKITLKNNWGRCHCRDQCIFQRASFTSSPGTRDYSYGWALDLHITLWNYHTIKVTCYLKRLKEMRVTFPISHSLWVQIH